jgi:hypothetical protein
MLQLASRTLLATVLLLFAVAAQPAPLAASQPTVLDGLRDPGYVLLAQDPPADLASPFASDPRFSWADLSNLYVTTDTTHLWVYVDLPGFSADSLGEFGLAIDTDGLAGSGATKDPKQNAINYAYDSIYNNVGVLPVAAPQFLLPDAVIRGRLYSLNNPRPIGWTVLDRWYADAWHGADVNWGGVVTDPVGSHIAFSWGHGLELSIPYADLGVPPTQTLHLEFYATGQFMFGHQQGAWDTIPSDTQADNDNTATTEQRLATISLSAPLFQPGLSFASASYSTTEAAGTVPITVTLSPTSTQPVSVVLRTADGTADAADYVAISQTVTFAAGQAASFVPIHVLTDTLAEPDETVILSLSQPVNAQLATPFTATLTIRDSPPPVPRRQLFLPFTRR